MHSDKPLHLLASLPVTRGHFRLESGLHTDVWIDFEPLFVNQAALAPRIAVLAAQLARHSPAAICGPFVGGAFLAQSLAAQMGLRFYFAEKRASSGEQLFTARYALPPALAPAVKGERVAVVDEAISAGSSVRAAIEDLEEHGATVVAVGTLMLLGSVGQDHFRARGIPVEALSQQDLPLWRPDDCPLCRNNTPLAPA